MNIFEKLIILFITIISILSSYLSVKYDNSIIYITTLLFIDTSLILNYINLFEIHKYNILNKIYSICIMITMIIFNCYILQNIIFKYQIITIINLIILLILMFTYIVINYAYINLDNNDNE